MSSGKADKWNGIYAAGEGGESSAAKVLAENTHLLPDTGCALDLACGRGANALLLARHGLDTHAWDISRLAISGLQQRAAEHGLSVLAETRDVTVVPLPANYFDVIVVSHFLERSIVSGLIAALKEHGLVYYQTFTRDRIDDSGPRNPAYRLARNELLQLFRGLEILYYREDGLVGDTTGGFRNEAMLIARKAAGSPA